MTVNDLVQKLKVEEKRNLDLRYFTIFSETILTIFFTIAVINAFWEYYPLPYAALQNVRI